MRNSITTFVPLHLFTKLIPSSHEDRDADM